MKKRIKKEFECPKCRNKTFIKRALETTIIKIIDDGEIVYNELTDSEKNDFTFSEPVYECEFCGYDITNIDFGVVEE